MDHLGPEAIAAVRPGDVVIGTLPANLAAEVCARGGRYFHLSLDLPPEAHGVKLRMEAMRRHGARIEEFEIRRVPSDREGGRPC